MAHRRDTVVRITDNILAETEYLGCNIGCVFTEQGPVLVDTPALPGDIRDLSQRLRSLSHPDIAYLIYTHEHFDHLIGGAHFTRRIVAHQDTVSEITYLKESLPKEVNRFFPDIYRQHKEAFDSAEIVLPQITFERELTLHMGDRTLRLFHAGGHSAGSLAVHIPEDKVLFAGDNIVSDMPLVTPTSLFRGWIDFLHMVEAMDIDIIIPGHGVLCGREAATKTRVYFEAMRDRVMNLFDRGASQEEIIRETDLTTYLPVAQNETVKQQVASTVAAMYEQVKKGMLGA